MGKTYPELLGEWVKRRKSTKRDQNLVDFFSVQDNVKAAIDAGFSLKTIWTNLSEERKVVCGYETFLSYVSRYVQTSSQDANAAPAADIVRASSRKKTRPTAQVALRGNGPTVKAPDAIPGFVFNPSPKKEDLI
jgi:hypothetical protein